MNFDQPQEPGKEIANTPDKKTEFVYPEKSVPGASHMFQHNEFDVDVFKLIHLIEKIPVTTVSVEDLMEQLDYDCWTDEKEVRFRPRELLNVLQNSNNSEEAISSHPEFSKHIKKIERVDSESPIIIFESRVVDGMHRLVKAVYLKQESMKAKILDTIPEEAIIKLQ